MRMYSSSEKVLCGVSDDKTCGRQIESSLFVDFGRFLNFLVLVKSNSNET